MATPQAGAGVLKVAQVLTELDDLIYMVKHHDYGGRLPSLKNLQSGKKAGSVPEDDDEEAQHQPEVLVHHLNKYIYALAELDQQRELFDGVNVPEELVYKVSGASAKKASADVDSNTNPEAFTVQELQKAEDAARQLDLQMENLEMLESALLATAQEAVPGLEAIGGAGEEKMELVEDRGSTTS